MNRFLHEHALFMVNVTLVSALVVFGATLQARRADDAQQILAVPPGNIRAAVPGPVVIGAPSTTVVQSQPQITPTSTRPAFVPHATAPRPAVRGIGYEDDD